MVSKNCYYDLNTENYAFINEISMKIHHTLSENDKILARLTTLVDTTFRFPYMNESCLYEDVQHTEIGLSSNKNGKIEIGAQQKSESGTGNCDSSRLESLTDSGDSSGSCSNASEKTSTENDFTDDYLRNYLDSHLDLGSIKCDETRFDSVKNPRIRQLLKDNYRLTVLKERKQAANKQILQVYNTYERLISEIIVPKLTSDVSAENIEKIAAAKAICSERKFPLEDEVWITYSKYVSNLESVWIVANKLIEFLQGHLHTDKLERLATEVQIVGNLIRYVKS